MASGGSHRLHPKRTLLKIRPDGLNRRSVGAMGASALTAGLKRRFWTAHWLTVNLDGERQACASE